MGAVSVPPLCNRKSQGARDIGGKRLRGPFCAPSRRPGQLVVSFLLLRRVRSIFSLSSRAQFR